MLGASREALAAAQERLEVLLGAASVDPTQLGDDLFSVTALLAGNAGLRRGLTDPARPADAKAVLVQRLLAGKVSDQALDLLTGVVRSRWSDPSDLVEAIEGLAVTAELFSAERAHRLDAVEDELFRFSRMVAADVSLRDAFAVRTVGAERKADLVRTLLDGKVSPETLRLAVQAAVSPRGMRTEQALDHYLEAAAARRRQLVAEVVAATVLTEGQRARLSTALRRIYGRDIRINLDVDPEVLGGLRIQVGGELIDSTVLSRLHSARRALAG
ncbi:MAG TPA: F0F1 ATP synthase subunit delta [Kineosporiaceae bacterium]|nr:F0F1 ATP synthase subunit delta [Kineosporiaceae bacterium]